MIVRRLIKHIETFWMLNPEISLVSDKVNRIEKAFEYLKEAGWIIEWERKIFKESFGYRIIFEHPAGIAVMFKHIKNESPDTTLTRTKVGIKQNQ